jgi:hypothetical protein
MFRMLARKDSPARPLHKRSQLRMMFLVLLVCSLLTSAIGSAAPAVANPFSNPNFRHNWQQADYPVAIGAVTRGFTWGPDPFFSTTEPYLEAPGGQRQVEYLDKARMEITRPDYDPTNPYYVTNGLLVKEMVSGLLQNGDYSFSQRFPAFDVPVAGDPVEINPDAPTYASFFALNNFYRTQPTPVITPTVSAAAQQMKLLAPSSGNNAVLADTPATTTPATTTPATTTPAVSVTPSPIVTPSPSPGSTVPPGSTPTPSPSPSASGNVPPNFTDNLLERQPDRTNEQVTATLTRNGVVGTNSLLGAVDGANYVYWERTLGHNIPKVFWNFLNQTGPIFNGNGLVSGKVFNWVQTMGYPITDAYWVRTNVAGIPRDVLVQLFERRILTYTPTNPAGYDVEMGNVGRHYYNWRYNPKYNLSLPLQSNTEVKPEAGFPGATFSIRIFRMIQNEAIQTTIFTPNGQPLVGSILTGAVPTGFSFFPVYIRTDVNTPPGQYTIVFKGVTSGNEAKAYFFVIGIPGYSLPA